MEENRQNKTPKEPETVKKEDYHIKRITIASLAIFITFCCCTLFFFTIYRYNGFADFWKKLIQSIQPIIIGLVIGYLLNPIMHVIERNVLKLLDQEKVKARIKMSDRRKKKVARGLGIAGALLFLVAIVVLLIAAIVPSVIQSIQGIVTTLPSEVRSLIDWINEFAKGDGQVAAIAEKAITQASNFFENWVITGVKFVINVLVGLIISVYVMASQEVFAGQAKKIIYAMFKPVRANVILQTVRKSNEIFGGFISGKLLDSAIIGVIAYVVLVIMKMPDAILVAVIVGVTNIIPFFGPFIGAIPSFLIIVLQNPIQGIYFLIFVVILQQIDGNIIGPKILGDSTGLSSFWVVFAILMFGGLWGFPGMLLGVPIMAVIYYVVDRIVQYCLRRRGIPVEEIDYNKLDEIDRDTNKPVYRKEDGERKKKQEKKQAG